MPVLVRRDRFLLERSETRWFSDTPHEPGSRTWGNRQPRIASLVWLRDRATGAPTSTAEPASRRAQVERLVRAMRRATDTGLLDDPRRQLQHRHVATRTDDDASLVLAARLPADAAPSSRRPARCPRARSSWNVLEAHRTVSPTPWP